MSKKIKNGSNGDLDKKKPLKKKRMTKKDLENVIQDLQNKELRLRAEFDNFRKRKETEISSILKYEGKSFILDFLSILDTINRGIDSYKDKDTKNALALIQKDFLKKMEERQITEFGEKGDTFDPDLHEALTTTSDKKKKDDEIVEVYEVGVKYKDLIIKHAKVVVNKK
ncbi:MAG: nucleotide exchange factor GrpE [Candidatus Neomarinimicrobiota bacterium]|nr:nucleotide exchange factor GrpE [Candidatus Neomarinimicrobiota bacterium]MEC9455696.1 nucleotide exchange factor GrpE [Candidatus Neomarinimicrobiota bacterium]MED5451375.1 nucleotide exchange factor GrpE [Candidatus Neomarinimicrobiota bacterium]MEE3241524.1 nucleotide exchange factor GrpE [Candidatus Neomarinimicrobiota bacterium]MEE3302045.1 nucleotide exchange factor GrpE [Candidatus Neomarinimicrobiota bacterium]